MRVRRRVERKAFDVHSTTNASRSTRLFRKIGRTLIEGTVGLAVTLLPFAVMADNTKKKPIVVAQAKPTDAGTDAAPKPIDISKLPRVALTELQRLERVGKAQMGKPGANSYYFSTDVVVTYNMNKLAAVGNIYYKDTTTRLDDGRVITTPAGTKRMAVRVNGKSVAVIDLTPLAKLYKQETGNEMKFLKLIPEVGKSRHYGYYISVNVAGVDKVDGQINGETPLYVFTVYPSTFKVLPDGNPSIQGGKGMWWITR